MPGRPGGYQGRDDPATGQPGQEQPEAGVRPRVLLVDDAAAIRNALRGVLEDAGIEVVGEAPDGVQGVALVGSLRPDVVLMDLRMPTSDGFQATDRSPRSTPASGSWSCRPTRPRGSPPRPYLAASAFAFLPKHCGADRIGDTVVAAWRSGRTRSDAVPVHVG